MAKHKAKLPKKSAPTPIDFSFKCMKSYGLQQKLIHISNFLIHLRKQNIFSDEIH